MKVLERMFLGDLRTTDGLLGREGNEGMRGQLRAGEIPGC